MNAIDKHITSFSQPVVAIPVCNEAHTISGCLAALADQTYRQEFEVVLLLNNCTDGTYSVVEALEDSLPFRLRVLQCQLSGEQANAGTARRMAMDYASDYTDGVILTTDADSYAARNWIAANMDAISLGADAVAGRAEIDPVDAARLPAKLLEDEARAQLLVTLLDRLDALIDPDPVDPWPRHTQHSGASIAVTVDCYKRAGRLPAIPLGEDRAFFQKLRQIDARIRHAPEVFVTVSGRVIGRAQGGMADTMRRRMEQPDLWLDEEIEQAASRAHRAAVRSLARKAWARRADPTLVEHLASALGLSQDETGARIRTKHFGLAWDYFERHSQLLHRSKIRAPQLEYEIKAALDIIGQFSPASIITPVAARWGSGHRRRDAAFSRSEGFSANHVAASINASSTAG